MAIHIHRSAQSVALQGVSSEAIDGVRFTLTNAASGTGTLRVKFKRSPASKPSALSSTYDYYGVPEEAYLELLSSKAPMTYITREIKPRFSYKRFTEDELAAEAAPPAPPPRPAAPPADDGTFDALMSQEDDILAGAAGTVKTAQALGPLRGDAPAAAMLVAVKALKPFRFHGLTFALREGTSPTGAGTWVASIIRRYPGAEFPDAHFQSSYARQGAALKMFSDKLLTYCRMLNFSGNQEALDQIGDGNVVRLGGNDFFVQRQTMLDLGDQAWEISTTPSRGERGENIQHAVAHGRQASLKGVAFTDKAQAEAYLCSAQLLADWNEVGRRIKKEKDRELEEQSEQRLQELLVDPSGHFDVSFSDGDDDFTFV